MRVKVGDTVYDAEEQPVMVILSAKDKENIASMMPEDTKYLAFPDGMNKDEATKFMEVPE